MWREKIIEAKKAKNITTKMMSERVRLPEPTITRILSGKTQTPRIDTVLGLGAAVGLSSMELFAETTLFLGDKNLAELEAELARANASIVALSEEITELKAKNTELTSENSIYKTKLDLQEETLSLYRIILNTKNQEKGANGSDMH